MTCKIFLLKKTNYHNTKKSSNPLIKYLKRKEKELVSFITYKQPDFLSAVQSNERRCDHDEI